MPRYFLEIAYRGTEFHGWQRQKNATGVQNVLEEALTRVLGIPITVKGASRTDAGAHARQNFAQMDLEHPLPERFLERLNWQLPEAVVCRGVYRVPDYAHVRFSVRTRVYAYCVHLVPDPYREVFSYRYWGRKFLLPEEVSRQLKNLHVCTRELLKVSDFRAFGKSLEPDQSAFCRVVYARWFWFSRKHQLIFLIEASRFLRGMIRGLVGTMLRVLAGWYTPEDFLRILHRGEKHRVDFSVPAHGLHLLRVNYPFRFVWERFTLS